MAWMGFIVKEKSERHPKGAQVSGKLETTAGAQAMKELLEKNAAKEGRKAEFFVTELTTKSG